MPVANYSPLSQPIPSPQLRKVVQSYLLKAVLDSLMACDADGQSQPGEQRDVTSAIGTIGVENVTAGQWAQRLFGSSGHQLVWDADFLIGIAALATPQCAPALEVISTSDLSEPFINRFKAELECRLGNTHRAAIPREIRNLYLGSIRLVPASCKTPDAFVYYAVTEEDSGACSVVGVWNLERESECTWTEVCAELQARGVPRQVTLICDQSLGLSAAIPTLFPPPDEISPAFERLEEGVVSPTPELAPSGPPLGHANLDMTMLRNTITRRATPLMSTVASVTVLALLLMVGSARIIPAPSHPATATIDSSAMARPSESALKANIAQIMAEIDLLPAGQALAQLTSLASHPSYQVRSAVARALVKAPFASSRETVAVLADLLHDQDNIVRGFAAKSLGRIGGEQAIALLKHQAAQERDAVVRIIIERFVG